MPLHVPRAETLGQGRQGTRGAQSGELVDELGDVCVVIAVQGEQVDPAQRLASTSSQAARAAERGPGRPHEDCMVQRTPAALLCVQGSQHVEVAQPGSDEKTGACKGFLHEI